MEFLKEVLGAELFAQVVEKINAHNGNEANTNNQIKLGNLGTGEYVAQGKYKALEDSLKGKETELGEANKLINDLKKATKNDADLQGKIADYDKQVADLQAQLQETKIKSAIKVALLSENAVDVDYLTFKLNESLKEKGETLELDENDNIKNWNDRLSGLKTQFPAMFENSGEGGNGGFTPIDNGGLPKGSTEQTVTKEEFDKMGYKSRVELKGNNPELYSKLK